MRNQVAGVMPQEVLIKVGLPADVLKARWMGLCKVSEKEEKEDITMQEEQAT